jgi:molybdopterin-containing oxidoreductase family membrane subunit
MAALTPQPPVSRDTGVLHAGWGYASISDKIADLVLSRPVRWPWLTGFAFTLAGTLVLVASMTYLFVTGVGIWGVNIPVAWGFAIANCVWWIGIGHAGTFISAVLLPPQPRRGWGWGAPRAPPPRSTASPKR